MTEADESDGGEVLLIGFDCSTSPKKAGLARGTWAGGRAGGAVVVREAFVGAADPAGVIAGWLADRPAGRPAVVAVDAPLGWPTALAEALPGHAAGDPLPSSADRLFHRATADVVRQVTGKRPLEVGANLIARTAAFALGVAAAVRERTGEPLPLLHAPGPPAGGGAGLIEVYPAATLLCRGLDVRGYKAPGRSAEAKRAARRALLEALAREAEWPADAGPLTDSDDALDAAVCVLAAADFLAGRVVRPPAEVSPKTLRREGWIWFGPPPGSPVGPSAEGSSRG